jgi:hypothetical protein
MMTAKWKGSKGEWLLGNMDRGASASIVKEKGDDYGLTSYWFGNLVAHRDVRDVTLASAKMTAENMRRLAEMALGDEPAGGKKRHAVSKDERLLAGMRGLGVRWPKGHALPTYPSRMTAEQKRKADKLYDAMSEQFIDKLASDVRKLLK